MRKASQSNLFYSLLALVFSLLLFFNANSQGNSIASVSKTQTYDEMLYNIPVQLEYDKDKYFVSGYEETVNVHLTSANRIQLNLEANEDTRNFQIVADLTQSSLGTSEVRLRATGLSTAVTADIEPKTLTITIEKKVTKSFNVETQLPNNIENDGYIVDKIAVTPKMVQITTGEETLKAIDKVIAPITSTKQTSETINQTVSVQAIDSKGQILSIELPAPQVKVNVELFAPTKEIPLQITATGTIPEGIFRYTFILSESKVKAKGSNQVLETLEKIEVPVDISGIRATKKKTIKIPNQVDYEVIPKEIEVTIIPVYEQTESSTLETNNNRSVSNSEIISPPANQTVPDSSSSSSSSDSNSSTSSDENLDNQSS